MNNSEASAWIVTLVHTGLKDDELMCIEVLPGNVFAWVFMNRVDD